MDLLHVVLTKLGQKKKSRTGCVAQVVECLPHKPEALTSIPSTSKTKENNKKKQF
jgi:hypothetical protein